MSFGLHRIQTASEHIAAALSPAGSQVTLLTQVPANVRSHYPNVAVLKSIDPATFADGTLIGLLGHYAAHDAVMPGYYYDANSTEEELAGKIIAPDTGAGRYILQYAGAVRASAMGVLGGEANAAADTAIMQLLANTCKEIILDVPLYLTSRLFLNLAGLTGETGTAARQPIRAAAGNNDRTLLEVPNNAKAITITNLDIDTEGRASSSASAKMGALWIRANVEDFTMDYCRLAQTGITPDIAGRAIQAQDLGCKNLRFLKSIITECETGFFFRGDMQNVVIEGCEISEFYNYGIRFSLTDAEPERFKIANCYIHHNKPDGDQRYPIEVGSSTSNQVKYLDILDNYFEFDPGTAHGAENPLGTGSGDVISLHSAARALVRGNKVYNSGAMSLTCSVNCDDVDIVDNQFFDGNGSGAFLGNGGQDIRFTSNTIVDCFQNHLNLVVEPRNWGGLTIRNTGNSPSSRAARHIFASNNRISNSDGGPRSHVFGIVAEVTDVFNLVVGDNDIYDPTEADIRTF